MRPIIVSLWLSLSIFSVKATAASVENLYQLHCASCHGKDGRAKTPIGRKLGVKDLTESKIPDAEIQKQIQDGRIGKDNKIVMPAFRDKIKEDQLSALVQHIKRLRK